jgi:hypothetical protein
MGFDNGTQSGGVSAQVKQFGSILRGFGPPVPQAGVVGDLYIDVQTWFLYEKRATNDTDPWGHYLFEVPAAYQSQLKWFSASYPGDSIGIAGDYCLLWGGHANYGLQPSIFGPKSAANQWPEGGNGPGTTLNVTGAGFAYPLGLADEGTTPNAYSTSSQLIVAGLVDEFILAIPVDPVAGEAIGQLGLLGQPANVAVVLNPLYTGVDTHEV